MDFLSCNYCLFLTGLEVFYLSRFVNSFEQNVILSNKTFASPNIYQVKHIFTSQRVKPSVVLNIFAFMKKNSIRFIWLVYKTFYVGVCKQKECGEGYIYRRLCKELKQRERRDSLQLYSVSRKSTRLCVSSSRGVIYANVLLTASTLLLYLSTFTRYSLFALNAF